MSQKRRFFCSSLASVALALGLTQSAFFAHSPIAHGQDAKQETSASVDAGWTHWRGPSANGIAHPSAQPPTKWSEQSGIKWTATLPGEGSATPIVWRDSIYVLSAKDTGRKGEKPLPADERSKTIPTNTYHQFIVSCLDRSTGKTKWEKVAIEAIPHEGKHQTHTYAAGSPTTDGEYLYASFASRGIYCYSLDGELVWQVDLGDMRTRFGWGEAVTPVLAGNSLIVNWDQEEGSFITALDKRSGKEIWRVERPGEATSWNTPLIVNHQGKTVVVVNGAVRARAYDAATGEEIWSCGGQTTNPIPSPVQYGDFVVCMSGYRAAAAFAIPLDSKGDVTGTSNIRWKFDQGTPYVPSPVISGDRLFFTGGNADILTVLDVRSGKSLTERKRLREVSSFYASPIVAGGHIYFVGRQGATAVLRDNDGLEEVAVNVLEGTFDASPVAVGNQLFLRSWDKLYCISEE